MKPSLYTELVLRVGKVISQLSIKVTVSVEGVFRLKLVVGSAAKPTRYLSVYSPRAQVVGKYGVIAMLFLTLDCYKKLE